jgi:hypothetical protein
LPCCHGLPSTKVPGPALKSGLDPLGVVSFRFFCFLHTGCGGVVLFLFLVVRFPFVAPWGSIRVPEGTWKQSIAPSGLCIAWRAPLRLGPSVALKGDEVIWWTGFGLTVTAFTDTVLVALTISSCTLEPCSYLLSLDFDLLSQALLSWEW